ncbi:MAG: hypothetical protein M0C28_32055 [Candidatus Moduliflexus flocculans]|nr:hypothetical protein [Candidatus Moduliflexus flocculans]
MGLVKRGNDLWFYEDLYSDVTYGFKVKKVDRPRESDGISASDDPRYRALRPRSRPGRDRPADRGGRGHLS